MPFKLFLRCLQLCCIVLHCVVFASATSLGRLCCRKSYFRLVVLKSWKVMEALSSSSFFFVQAWMGLGWVEVWGIFNFLKMNWNGLGFFATPLSRGRVSFVTPSSQVVFFWLAEWDTVNLPAKTSRHSSASTLMLLESWDHSFWGV